MIPIIITIISIMAIAREMWRKYTAEGSIQLPSRQSWALEGEKLRPKKQHLHNFWICAYPFSPKLLFWGLWEVSQTSEHSPCYGSPYFNLPHLMLPSKHLHSLNSQGFHPFYILHPLRSWRLRVRNERGDGVFQCRCAYIVTDVPSLNTNKQEVPIPLDSHFCDCTGWLPPFPSKYDLDSSALLPGIQSRPGPLHQVLYWSCNYPFDYPKSPNCQSQRTPQPLWYFIPLIHFPAPVLGLGIQRSINWDPLLLGTPPHSLLAFLLSFQSLSQIYFPPPPSKMLVLFRVLLSMFLVYRYSLSTYSLGKTLTKFLLYPDFIYAHDFNQIWPPNWHPTFI